MSPVTPATATPVKAPVPPRSWVQQELGAVTLGDKRLNQRLLATAEQLAAQPTAPLNQACADWAATKASYRLFQNKRVAEAAILAPHQTQTQARMAEHELVLAVQDTTYLDYSTHPQTTGLGPIGTPRQQLRGLVQHTTLALTPAGLPLGILAQEIWARDPEAPELSAYERRKRPIAEKESYKWLTALRKTVQQTPVGTTVVSVCDREADIYELFVEAERLATGLLVRATQDRALLDPETGKVWATVSAAPVQGHVQVHVPARHDEPARDAIVTVQSCQVTLKPPWRPKRLDQEPLPPISLDVVLVQEVTPPDHVTPLEWLLLTNVPVRTFTDAVERVQWYRCRWHIEVYFKVYKSGCRVEDCRLGTVERLQRFLTLSSVIAWRLYWLTHINRQLPEAPCTLILTAVEWHTLYAKMQRTTHFPAQPPTVRQAVHWIARLGGFLARRRDGAPGITAIWRGWQRLQDMVDIWNLTCNDTYG